MFNVGGGELLVILLIALIFLGPHRLPDAMRQVGRFMAEMRRVSNGFQAELRDALEEPLDFTSTRRSPLQPATPSPSLDTPLDPEVAAAVEAANSDEPAGTEETAEVAEPAEPGEGNPLTS